MSSSATDTIAEGGSAGSAPVEVVMPQMGVSVAEGTIAGWAKSVGDPIEADEVICEVTTDKIDVEIPAPATGVVESILVDEGETVTVGTLLATIGTAAPANQPSPSAPSPEPAATEPAPEIDRSGFISPVVQRMADEHEIDLASVHGQGIGGRIRKQDLVALIADGRESPAERPLHSDSPYRPDEPEGAAPSPAFPQGKARGDAVSRGAAATPADARGISRVPLDPMRKAIAEHMVASRRTAAHCTTIVEADFSAVVRSRAQLKESMAARGVGLTYLAFVARATVEALQRYPVLNASFDGERGELIHHDDVNLGIAVALEGGLVVPVIQRAQRLSLEGLAAAIGDLAQRARSGSLQPDDVRGGTFTITNPGQFGAMLATPIINQPEVAILDLEAIVRRPAVVSDAEGNESIGIRPISYLCMSWDHRALDGALAARFLGTIRETLETVPEPGAGE